MSSAELMQPVPEVFPYADPWTEAQFLAPSARLRHQRLSFRLAAALDAAVPPGLQVLEAINVRARDQYAQMTSRPSS